MRDPAVKTDHQEYEDWWTVFHDPTLDRLIEIAYAQNLTLLAAGTRGAAGAGDARRRHRRILPAEAAVGADVGYNQASQVDPTSNPLHMSLENYWRASLGIQAAWELDFWGKFRRGVESADAAYLASIATYDDVLVTLLGDVATTYIGIRTLQKQIIYRARQYRQAAEGAADRARPLPRRHRDQARRLSRPRMCWRRREAGGPAADGPVAARRGCAARAARHDAASRSARCWRRTGKHPGSAARIVAVGIPADLLRRRPDVRGAELKAAAQSAQIGVAKADLYPAFSLTGASAPWPAAPATTA